MLMAAAFLATYIIVTGPLANATLYIVASIKSGILNTVQNGEWREGEVVGPGEADHPGSPGRFRAVHL